MISTQNQTCFPPFSNWAIRVPDLWPPASAASQIVFLSSRYAPFDLITRRGICHGFPSPPTCFRVSQMSPRGPLGPRLLEFPCRDRHF